MDFTEQNPYESKQTGMQEPVLTRPERAFRVTHALALILSIASLLFGLLTGLTLLIQIDEAGLEFHPTEHFSIVGISLGFFWISVLNIVLFVGRSYSVLPALLGSLISAFGIMGFFMELEHHFAGTIENQVAGIILVVLLETIGGGLGLFSLARHRKINRRPNAGDPRAPGTPY